MKYAVCVIKEIKHKGKEMATMRSDNNNVTETK